MPGRKPLWKWNDAHGLMTRNSKSKAGIDWWRYGQHILLPKLLPFALHCMKSVPDTVVQEDNAPSHACKHQERLYMNVGVFHLLWPGNSPDLNMIEPCWPWMKRQTTRRGAPSTRELLEKAWLNCWNNELSMRRIRSWIERIPLHIQEVIRLKRGNEYQEGRFGETSSIRPYDSEARKERYQR